MIRFLTAGESHGPGLVTIVEGLPKGLSVAASDFETELARRRGGHGRGRRMAVETDEIEILAGVRHGATLGSPVAVVVRNAEWEKWADVMSVGGEKSGKKITRPRPGHADLAGMIKYATDDARDVLERASARETAARAVVGTLAKALLGEVGAAVVSHVVSIGGVWAKGEPPGPDDLDTVDRSAVRCFDPGASERMVEAIDAAAQAKDTLGGVFEVLAYGVPPGIGSHVHYDRRLDTIIAGSLMSIPAIKGVEIGDGFELADQRGSAAHDEIAIEGRGVVRLSNRAGGVEGGMSNGESIRARAAMKPLSTLMRPLATVDVSTGKAAKAVRERSDVCAVPAAAIVGEHMMAIALAAEYQRKFGGDTVEEFSAAAIRYQSSIGQSGET
ncbi:MAG: chorismate synthase [Acidimicrobiia bacterium]|nr:chorismate synthase [Acidimicrobiia bacterium]